MFAIMNDPRVQTPPDAVTMATGDLVVPDDDTRALEQLLRADTAGEFEIEGLLGRGGMGFVFSGTEIRLGRKVAIKVLPADITFGPGVERFKQEARIAAGLNHPNIIPVYRISSGRLFWYAMKYVEGTALDRILSHTPRLPLEHAIGILAQVASALDYAHRQGVVHRDIKPANIIIDPWNHATVADFGIAKPHEDAALTATGALVGTPHYMSPEQSRGRTVTGASDQYSLAVMAYRMLCGQVPFDGESSIDVLQKHVGSSPPPLDTLMTDVQPHVAWAVQRALSKDPARRFPTAAAFVAALRQPTPEALLAQGATMTVSPPAGLAPRTRRRIAISAGLALTLTAVLAAGWPRFRPAGPAPEAVASVKTAERTREMPVQPRGAITSTAASGNVAANPDSQAARLAVLDDRAAAISLLPPVLAGISGRITPWARVWVDDRDFGNQAVLKADSLVPGSHRLRLERDGFVAVDTVVDLIPGEQRRMTFTLERAVVQ